MADNPQGRSLQFTDLQLTQCPICRTGTLREVALMDAYTCEVCRHFFSINLEAQILQVEDLSRPMLWRWGNGRWQAVSQSDASWNGVIALIAIVLLVIPVSLIWLPAQIFPPLPGSRAAGFASVWAALTFGLHGLMALWLLVEHFQVPVYLRLKIRVQDFLRR